MSNPRIKKSTTATYTAAIFLPLGLTLSMFFAISENITSLSRLFYLLMWCETSWICNFRITRHYEPMMILNQSFALCCLRFRINWSCDTQYLGCRDINWLFEKSINPEGFESADHVIIDSEDAALYCLFDKSINNV